jgi:hypothetical protein
MQIVKFLFLILVSITYMLGGCSSKTAGPDVILLDSQTYSAAFDAAVAAADADGMKPVLLDRRSGVISTDPAIAASFLEPWKPQASTARQGLENTLAMQRRVARFEFTPVTSLQIPSVQDETLLGPDLLSGLEQDLTTYSGQMELRVWVYVDRKYTQGIRRGTWSLSNESVTEVLPAEQPWEQVPGSFWVPINRDVVKERMLLTAIKSDISE